MGAVHESISQEFRSFIERQRIFFVATAPLDGAGHVNLSPKGLDTFRVLSEREVAYLDLTGSGNETSAHLAENGRITFMFCAFEGKPLILRLYGRGRTVLPGAGEWQGLIGRFPEQAGVRQIIVAEISRVQTSCGYAVPLMEAAREREALGEWAERKGETGLRAFRKKHNLKSLDGLATPLGIEEKTCEADVRPGKGGGNGWEGDLLKGDGRV